MRNKVSLCHKKFDHATRDFDTTLMKSGDAFMAFGDTYEV